MRHVVVPDGDLAQVVYVGHRIGFVPQGVEIPNVGPNIYQLAFFDGRVVGVWRSIAKSILFGAIIVDTEIPLGSSIA